MDQQLGASRKQVRFLDAKVGFLHGNAFITALHGGWTCYTCTATRSPAAAAPHASLFTNQQHDDKNETADTLLQQEEEVSKR